VYFQEHNKALNSSILELIEFGVFSRIQQSFEHPGPRNSTQNLHMVILPSLVSKT